MAAVAVGLVAATPGYLTPAFADPRDDKRTVDRELARVRSMLESATERAQDATVAYADASGRLPAARERVAEARGLVAAAEVAADRTRREARQANRKLRRANLAYRSAENRVTDARERVGEFVSAAYKGGGAVAFTSLLSAESPSDLADRMAYLDDLASDQRTALDRVVELRHDAKRKQNAAVLAKQRADQAKRDADNALAAAHTARDAAARAEASVRNLVNKREAALRTAAEEREATLERYRDLRRESARIQADIRALAARDRGRGRAAAGSGGRFVMPARGWKSSDFGWRWDPYYRVWQLHAGMDIAAPGGSLIRAAAAGRVFRAGWNGGYGRYTCLYHGLSSGKGLATCYAHQSRIGVSYGQHVRRGQVIGAVGTTGASTGDHLHFEVRLNGTPVNPLRWLPACLC
ncbi:MAG TPA: peptidoglycan DD-metalloendopeptidase family protein [Micromonosporaceae bacterium]